MNLNIIIAKRIGNKNDSTGKLSKLGSRIAVIAVALSIAVIIVSIAVSNGFRKEIRDKARGFASDMVISTIGNDIISEMHSVNDNLSGIKEVSELYFVDRVSPVSYKNGILRSGDNMSGILLKGVDDNYNLDFYSKNLIAGELPKYNADSLSFDILISKRLANTMGYSVGDKLYAFFVGEQLQVKTFNLIGIFDAQIEQLDKVFAVADIKVVNMLNGWINNVSCFEVYTKSKFLLDNEAEYQRNKVLDIIYSSSKENDTSVLVYTLKDRFYFLFDWLHLLDLNVYVILALMIAVAGFNMVSGLLIMLFERISQIGLFKALGMTNRGVANIFLTKAAFVVLKGMLIGNLLAIGLCLVQLRFKVVKLDIESYMVSVVPIDFNIWNILLVNIISFIAIMLIMFIPCHFISKISPASTMKMN